MSVPQEHNQEYRKIYWSLKNHEWEHANRQTLELLDQLDLDKLDYSKPNFPCQELKILDEWWREFSNEHFGFSSQIEILTEISLIEQKNQTTYHNNVTHLGTINKLIKNSSLKFVQKVGWYKQDHQSFHWENLKFDLVSSPQGHLPSYLVRPNSQKQPNLTKESYYHILNEIKNCDPYFYNR